MTADGLYDKRMLELAQSVIEVGKSDPVDFGWGEECAIYNLDNRQTAADPSPSDENIGSESAGTIPLGHGGVRGQRQSNEVEFRVEVDQFVALKTSRHLIESVLVGKVISVRAGDEGQELKLRWYMPKQVVDGTQRSEYGKGGWTPEFVVESGKRVPSIGMEYIGAISSTFARLTAQDKLPRHVWRALAESTLVPGDPDMELGDEEEEEPEKELDGAGGSMPQEPPLPVGLPQSPVPSVQTPGGEGGRASLALQPVAGVGLPESPERPEAPVETPAGGGGSASTASQPVETSAPTHVAAHPNVRKTLATFRSKRTKTSTGRS